MQIRDEIKSTLAEFLKTGSTANKVYVRVRPDGSADITEETGWTCSVNEYCKQTPHTLSLEIPIGVRDYRNLNSAEIDDCVDARFEAAEQLLEGWDYEIEIWIEAGNLAVEATCNANA